VLTDFQNLNFFMNNNTNSLQEVFGKNTNTEPGLFQPMPNMGQAKKGSPQRPSVGNPYVTQFVGIDQQYRSNKDSRPDQEQPVANFEVNIGPREGLGFLSPTKTAHSMGSPGQPNEI
jgi:hypothetical protein